jgi:hypothetical protein
VVLAALTGAYAAARAIHEPHWPTDFDQLWHAARALLDGTDPYAVVGRGRAFQWDWPLYYPLPAVVFSTVFAWLPVPVARVLFSTMAGAVLGWAAAPRIHVLWPLLLSAAYIIATSRTQWSPLLLAAAFMPALGFFITAKPNVGLGSLAALSGRQLAIAIGGCLAAITVSFLLFPDWFARWREATSISPHIVAPILLPGGFVLLLAVLRWRRPDARLLLALSVVPHTPSLYDLVLLFFACRTLRETIVLATLTHALYWGIVVFASFPNFDAYAVGLGKAAIFVVYLPVLVMILLRPNLEGEQVTSGQPPPAGWRSLLPDSRTDVTLLVVLGVAAAMLIWLPLVTYR